MKDGTLMIKRRLIAFIFIASVQLAGFSLFSQQALDPLRGAELKTYISGPAIGAGALKGKVVFFEYWGFS